MARGKTRMYYVKKLDSIFSRYIRLYKSDKGICTCITCNKRMWWTEAQNGHFISRKHYKYRRDIDNCRVQDSGCNIFLHGNYQVYTLKMIDMFGREKVDKMLNDRDAYKISTPEIIDLIEYYEKQVEILLANLSHE